MKRIFAAGIIFGAVLAAPAGAAEGSYDRLTLAMSGSTLTGADDGGAAGVGWLHNFSANTIMGLRGEYNTIADAHWEYGALSLAHGFGQASTRTNLYADVAQGSGKDTGRSFDYSVVYAGIIQNITRQLAIQIEDKHIDIDTTRGNLPKLGIQYVWSTSLLTNLSYAHSVSGNLGTRLWTLRVDRYGKKMNLIIGGAGGRASPAVVDLQSGIETSGATLREAFIGVTKPFPRVDVTLLGDYLEIADTERMTVTLNFTVRLRGPAK